MGFCLFDDGSDVTDVQSPISSRIELAEAKDVQNLFKVTLKSKLKSIMECDMDITELAVLNESGYYVFNTEAVAKFLQIDIDAVLKYFDKMGLNSFGINTELAFAKFKIHN